MIWLLIGLAVYLLIGVVLIIIIANSMYGAFMMSDKKLVLLYIVAYPYFIIMNLLNR